MRRTIDNRMGMLAALGFWLAACSTQNAQPQSGEEREGDVAAANAPLRGPAIGSKLMIIGNIDGELVGQNSRDSIFTDRLIADVGGAQNLHVLVVAGASASPAWLGGYLRSVLAFRGITGSQTEVAQIASEDDDTTADVDESTWQNGAYRPSEVAKVARANVVWFAGGDQNRLTSLLLTSRGKDTPFLAALRTKLQTNNLILVGYSAGAAVFSDPMIGNGTSYGALNLAPSTDPTCSEDEALCVSPGLGFVPTSYHVVVDQHFEQRGRFARLVRALALTNERTGWGISTNGAFYVDLQKRTAEVVGNPGDATVTVVGRQGSAANHEQAGPPFLGDSYTVSVLGTGDVYALPDATHPHGLATHSEASEVYAPFSAYYDAPEVLTDAFGDDVLIDKVTESFADATAQASGARVDSIAFKADEQGNAKGFRMRFTADTHSTVAWNEDTGYSMFDARLQLSTISAKFVGLEP
ncbi:MAG TPA: cyanophycinase [Polyangiaceae bacterium]|nr:cyanophycinase [Polyangiaceae bacterium]